MAAGADGLPVVALPERIDRRLRLGPFPSAQDALKFLCYAAAGAALAELASLPAGLAVVAVGFVAAVWRPDGRSWEERLLAFLRWQGHATAGGILLSGLRPGRSARSGLLELGPADHVAVVRTGGIPITYLPPSDLARRFELFRELLRATDGRIAFLATLGSIRTAPFLPAPEDRRSEEAPARAGYSELVGLLCRRRFRRKIYLVVGVGSGGAEARARLETEIVSLEERLTNLGLRPVRLRGRGLIEAAREIGWSAAEARE